MPAGVYDETRLRLDKWLFRARFCRTRASGQAKVRAGSIRINGRRVDRPSVEVGPGDIVTLIVAREVLVVRVRALGLRRGSATEAQELYERVQENA